MATEEWPPKSNKSSAMQRIVSSLIDEKGNVYDRADCVTCGKTDLKPEDFKDELSIKEFGISRMCQECQDSIFNEEDEECIHNEIEDDGTCAMCGEEA